MEVLTTAPSQARPRQQPAAEAHLHFDREARVWRTPAEQAALAAAPRTEAQRRSA
jgi:hypothetical protein